MKRYSAVELETLLKGTTEGIWSEGRIATVFRSSSFNRTQSVLMAQVKGDDGIAPSDHARANGILMAMARNFAMELLDYKLHRYGQDDCSGCADRDAEIEKLKERVAWLESQNDFDAKRLRRLATLCGVSIPESDETLLNCAGTVLGSIIRGVEARANQSQDTLHKAFQVIRSKKEQFDLIYAENLRLKESLRPDQVGDAIREAASDVALAKARELECKDCQQINFHEDCHAVQEKTAVRCVEIAATFNDGHYPLGMQARIAAAIREEFGVEDGGICPECRSDSTITTETASGVQGDGQEVGVTTYLCLPCRHIWSE